MAQSKKKPSLKARVQSFKVKHRAKCLSKGTSHNVCEERAQKAAKGYRKRIAMSKAGKKRCGCPKGTRSLTLKGGRKVCGKTRPRKKC